MRGHGTAAELPFGQLSDRQVLPVGCSVHAGAAPMKGTSRSRQALQACAGGWNALPGSCAWQGVHGRPGLASPRAGCLPCVRGGLEHACMPKSHGKRGGLVWGGWAGGSPGRTGPASHRAGCPGWRRSSPRLPARAPHGLVLGRGRRLRRSVGRQGAVLGAQCAQVKPGGCSSRGSTWGSSCQWLDQQDVRPQWGRASGDCSSQVA